MYLIVNNDLKMGKGKIAAQVGHVVGDIIEYLTNNPTKEYEIWKKSGHAKIVLKATESQILELCDIEESFFVRDQGRTQIPKDSLTVVGFPPVYKSKIYDQIKKLKLL